MAMDIGIILGQLERVGVFDFLLPFLLVFALVFGILTATNILGHNKRVSVIIALVIGLMSLRLGFMQAFMSEIFPRLGIGLTILVSILILVGLFIPKDEARYWGWGLGAIGVIIAIVIVVQSFNTTGLWGFSGSEDFVGLIIGAVLLIGVIIAVAASGGKSDANAAKTDASYKPWRDAN